MHRGLPQARAFTARAACCSASFLLAFLPAIASAGAYSGGAGTQAEPFRISTVSDWQELTATPSDWASHFVLTADIDLNNVPITPVGNDANNFTGVFDGNDYVIRNADVNMPGSDYVGLFGYVGTDGQIRNLRIPNVATAGRRFVGGLVGRNDGTMSNCCSSGLVTGSGDYVGGLVGRNDDSYYNAPISRCYSTGPVSGTDHVGGLVGQNSNPISNCYSTGSVSGTSYVAGLVAQNFGTISNCYSTGSVGGTGSYLGGLLGWNRGAINASFWDVNTSGWTTSMRGTPKTTAEMMTLSTFVSANWDFIGETGNGTEDIWAICEGTNYPRFVYQIPQGDIACPDGVNGIDYSLLARYWHETGCAALNDCDGADIDLSGAVDFGDVAAVAESWLRGVE